MRQLLKPLLIIAFIIPATLTGSAQQSTSYVVTNTNDAGAGSLHAAIVEANDANTPVIITFRLPASSVISLTSGGLAINGANTNLITIDGGSKGVAIDTNNKSRVFTIAGKKIITLQNLRLINGNTVDGASSNGIGGGAVLNNGTLTVDNCTLSNNQSSWGGGIFNDVNGTVAIYDTTLSDNSAFYDGGAIWNDGTMSINSTRISNNLANSEGSSTGGGAYNTSRGKSTITNSTFFGNITSYSGGGIQNVGTLVIGNSIFFGNRAIEEGGGLDNYNDGTASIDNTMFFGNRADIGGGIDNAIGAINVSNSIFLGNVANVIGGAIYNDGGTVTLFNTAMKINLTYHDSDTSGIIDSTSSANTK